MGIVRNVYSPQGDGTPVENRHNRQGNAVVQDAYEQWVNEGRVFCSSDADGDDAIAAIATWVVTTPQLLLQVPVGTTCKPLWLTANNLGTTAGTTGAYIIMYDKIDRYASGGTAEGVSAMRTDAPHGNKVVCRSTPTAAAASDARTLFVQHYETDQGTTGAVGDNLMWSAKSNFSPLLVGPAAFLLWIEGDATSPFAWSAGWAEFPTGEIT